MIALGNLLNLGSCGPSIRTGDVVRGKNGVHQEHADREDTGKRDSDGRDLLDRCTQERGHLCLVDIEELKVDERSTETAKCTADDTANPGDEREAVPLGYPGSCTRGRCRP